MQTLLLGVAVPLLLCFETAVVYANGVATTRKTLFEGYDYISLSLGSRAEYQEFVYSYHVPILAEVEGVMVAVVEARYKHYLLGYAGEVVVKYSTDQGDTWKTIIAIPRKTKWMYARSVNPIVVPYKKNLHLFAERFEEWNYDWRNYKSGGGDFVYSSSHKVIYVRGNSERTALEFRQPTSFLHGFTSEMNKLQITRLLGGYGRGIEVNGTSIVPVWFIKTNGEMRPTVLLSGSPNWRLADGTGDPGSRESAVVEWEGKLIMNARTDDGYRKVYESTDMGGTWNEALGSLSRVWGNSPYRRGNGCSASFITVTIEETPVMLFSHPLNTFGRQDQLHLWLTDNKRIYDVGQISAFGENTGHSSLLYTNGSLYCLYAKERYGTLKYYSSVLAHLVDELKKIKAIVKKWKTQDRTFSGSCDSKDSSPSYPGSTCDVNIPQNGLVGFLSDEATTTHWKDAYSCVDALLNHGTKVENGIKFNGGAPGAFWPVGFQGQNQRYHFMNHKFTLAATIIIHECKDRSPTPLLSVVLDTQDKKLFEILCTNTGKLSFKDIETKTNQQTSFTPELPIRVVFTFHERNINLYIDGQLMLASKLTKTHFGFLSTPILYICILQCDDRIKQIIMRATVKNVLLYNRVLSKKEIDLLYLQLVTTETKTISQSMSKTRTVSYTMSHTITESQSLTHTRLPTRTKSLTHTGTLTRTGSITRTKSLTMTESLTHTGSLTNTESLTPTESLTNTESLTPTESLTNTESLTPTESLTNTESLTPTESLTNTESLTPTESLTNTESLTPTESLTNTGSLTPTESLTKAESLTHTGSLTRTESLMHRDSLTQTEFSPSSSYSISETLRQTTLDVPVLPMSSPENGEESTKVICPELYIEDHSIRSLSESNKDTKSTNSQFLFVHLPLPFCWESNRNVSFTLRFMKEAGHDEVKTIITGNLDELLQNRTHKRNSTSCNDVLQVPVSMDRDHHYDNGTKVVISVDSRAVRGGCLGELSGFIVFVNDADSQVPKGLAITNGVVASAATVALVLTGGLGSILEIQALGIFSKMPCAPVEERFNLIALPYFLSFFAGWGPLWIIAGNALIIIVFGAVHYGLTVLYQRWRTCDKSLAWAQMHFPSLTYLVVYTMHMGIFVCGVFLLAMPKAEAYHYAVGALGAIYGVAFPFAVLFYIYRCTNVKFVLYWQFAKKSWRERWWYPVGYWAPLDQQMMHNSMFSTMRGGYLYWCVFYLSVVCIAGAVAVIPTPTGKCHLHYFCLAGILFIGAAVAAIANMMRSVVLTVMHTLSLLLLSVLCLVHGIHYLMINTYILKPLLTLAVLVVVLCISVYNAVLWYIEWIHWKNVRDPTDNSLVTEKKTNGQGISDPMPHLLSPRFPVDNEPIADAEPNNEPCEANNGDRSPFHENRTTQEENDSLFTILQCMSRKERREEDNSLVASNTNINVHSSFRGKLKSDENKKIID